ncbi:MAG: site-2 protease family protein [Caldilineales bacterium]|nr:site-2 protease family protein [Caldilineales bacterium]
MSTDSLVQGRLTEQLQAAVADHFLIESIRFDVPFGRFGHAIRLSGRFISPTNVAYDAIAGRAAAYGLLIFFRREREEEVIYAAQGTLPRHQPRWALAILLFIATLASVFLTGGLQETRSGLSLNWREGLAFALPLMAILLTHEMGHFLVGRHYRMAISPPFFIPLPIVSLGTLGAVIVMLAPPKNRRQLLQMGAAGPLAGLAVAIPILLYGLSTSTVAPLPNTPFMLEGNSLFYGLVKWLLFGRWLPSGGLDVHLNNIAFAGWVGLLVTALNLIPAGQLDGGHAAFTLFGPAVRPLTWVLIVFMLGLAALTQFWGWLVWAGLLFVFGQVYAVPMDDLTPLDGRHKALAAFMLILAVLLFTPIPLRLIVP